MPAPRVLSIGQCGFDNGAISRTFQSELGAAVDPADTLEEARDLLETGEYALILINRQLDIDHSSGLSVLKQLRADHPATPMMLVSNYPEAQQQAQQAGAQPGFGKATLNNPEILTHLKQFLPTNNDK
jgi:two-component system chemotaxis response regulator CheY